MIKMRKMEKTHIRGDMPLSSANGCFEGFKAYRVGWGSYSSQMRSNRAPNIWKYDVDQRGNSIVQTCTMHFHGRWNIQMQSHRNIALDGRKRRLRQLVSS